MADGDAESTSQNHQNSSSASSVSSTEFHENLLTSFKDHGHGMSSVPPDFIPLKRSSWRSSSVAECTFGDKYRDEAHSKDEPGSDESSPSAKFGSDGSDIRVSRAETGSMKESKTFAFGLRQFTEPETKSEL